MTADDKRDAGLDGDRRLPPQHLLLSAGEYRQCMAQAASRVCEMSSFHQHVFVNKQPHNFFNVGLTRSADLASVALPGTGGWGGGTLLCFLSTFLTSSLQSINQSVSHPAQFDWMGTKASASELSSWICDNLGPGLFPKSGHFAEVGGSYLPLVTPLRGITM